MKWIVASAAAALAATFILTGVASAHEAGLSGSASECRDAQGAFTIDWTLTSEAPDYRELDGFDEDEGFFGELSESFGIGSVDDGVISVIDGGVAPDLGLEDFTDSSDGDTLDDDGIHGDGSATAQTAYDGSIEPDETIYAEGRVQWSSTSGNSVKYEQNVRSNDVNRPDYCKTTVCEDGDYTEQAVNEINVTSDCGFFNACINGEVERINEYDAEQLGYEEGVCDHENPPPPPPAEEDPPVEEEEDEVAVAEVAPVVEEVAALPAAGYGSTANGSGLTWVALLSLALAGLGTATIVMARR